MTSHRVGGKEFLEASLPVAIRRPTFMRSSTLRQWHGFTLIELLVTLGVISILASLLLPALAGGRARADSARCLSNLRQIGIAVRMYSVEHEGFLPHAEGISASSGSEPAGETGGSPVRSLDQTLISQISGNKEVFKCPADRRKNPDVGRASFEWNVEINGRLLHRIEDATGTWLVRDLEGWHPKGKRNAVFVDGHAAAE